MSGRLPLNVVLYWHMHQPEYRDLRNGHYLLPWTYLHAIKDYSDMVAHLEQHPEARAVVNFAPVLLEQIDDYQTQLNNFLHHNGGITDELLAALANPVIVSDTERRRLLIKDCLRANEDRLINRFKPFRSLVALARQAMQEKPLLDYLGDQFVADLLVWYHLAWIGETVRRSDLRVERLMAKERIYSAHDRRELLELMHEIVASILPRYRKLYEQGRIELSVTPYAHPIMPLLLDINTARDAVPDAPLPSHPSYPDGKQRCEWHIRHGLEVFRKHFGCLPDGCWPSEGSISGATIELLGKHGFRWLASGETVLHNALDKSGLQPDSCIHQPYLYREQRPACFFRDDGLSDLIGFTYSDWHADDAVANLIDHLERIAEACEHREDAIVSIILDGENAWEYYPENGYYFLNGLYEKLSEHPGINLTTYSAYLDQQDYLEKAHDRETTRLTEIVAGSWVYGSLSTWIGEKDKNRAWDMLIEAKQVFDEVLADGKLSEQQLRKAEHQLAICEGSDWFWWFGDYNPADSVASFDEQYRIHLAVLYDLLNREPPEYLSHVFSHGTGAPAMGGVMLPGKRQ